MRISDWSSDVCSSDLCRLSGMAVGILLLRNRNMIATGVRKVLLDWKLVRGVSSTGEAIFSENPSFSMINEKNLYSMTDAPDFPELSVSDRKILKALQDNGRRSNAEMARQAGQLGGRRGRAEGGRDAET